MVVGFGVKRKISDLMNISYFTYTSFTTFPCNLEILYYLYFKLLVTVRKGMVTSMVANFILLQRSEGHSE